MKKIYSVFLIFFLLSSFSFTAYSQTDCGNNADFETGLKAPWIGKYGVYGASIWSDTCPIPAANYCPTFPLNYTTPNGFINNNGNDALGTTFVDRHTIMTKNYRPWAGAGIGKDSISNNTVPVVAPGGNFSFRLGDEVAGGVGVNPNRYARAEAVRFTFLVNPLNAGFTYLYSVFLQDPGHLPEEQPRFEVFVTLPDLGDSLIPCGYYKFIAGSSNPYCAGTRDSSTFKFGLGSWRYTDWTAVGLDLSGYIGQNIAVEFRTSDCFPNNSVANPVVYNIGGVTTTCYDGHCCWGSAPQTCTTISSCTNTPGTHSAYAYIDAFCSPITTVPLPVCTGTDSVQICAPPGYKDWLWPNGSTTSCIYVQNPTPGDSFTVQMHSQAGCPTKSTVKLTGTDVLVRDTAFCEGTSGNVTLACALTFPGNYTFLWTGPGGYSSNLQNPVIPIPAATSTYTINVTDTAAHCVYVKEMEVAIWQNPIVNISPGTTICIGGTVQLSSSGPSISCAWSPGTFLDDSLSCTPISQNPTITTLYTVVLTDTNGCQSTDTTRVTVNQISIATAGASPSPICNGSSTTLTATPGMTYYLWSPATTSPSTSATTASPSVTTTYTVAVRNAGGCADTTTVTVIVNPNPIPKVSPNISICLSDTTILTASGGSMYSWTPTAGLDLPLDSLTPAHPSTTTLYTVYVSDIGGCMDDTSVMVSISPPPVACTNNVTVCLGEPAQLDASCSFGTGYSWLPDPTLSDETILDPVATTNVDKTYTIVIWTNPNCLTDSATATVTVHPLPTVTASPDIKIQAGTYTQLTATGTGISYNWNPTTALSCPVCPDPLANPLVTTVYIVTTIDSNNCVYSDTVIVTVEDIFTLYVPNAFIPVNYQDHNTVFYAMGVGIWEFEFYIFDRWGTLLFESHDPDLGWDGTYKGKYVQQDVYTYLAKARSITGKTITKTGPVTVVK